MSVTVFLLEDHEVVREGLRRVLEAAGLEVVGESSSAEQAARRIPAQRPQVAILDGRLPDGSGIDVCREVRSRDPRIACLILTSYDDEEALLGAVLGGAAGYLLKQVSGTSLIDAVLRAAAGESLLDPELAQRVREKLTHGRPEDPRLRELTDQERRVLLLIGEGLTNRQIGERLFLAEKTVKNYVSNLLAKLGMERRTQAAIFASRLHDRSP